jgi:OmpA-OmpF porin, OOP family
VFARAWRNLSIVKEIQLMKFNNKALALAVLSFTGTNVMAAGYVGIGFGSVDPDLTSDFSDPTSFELIGGFNLNETVSAEISYLDLGDSSDGIAPVWTVSATGLTMGLVARAPINQTVDIFVKGGLMRWDMSVTEDGLGEFYSNNGTDLFFGFGLNARLNSSFSAGLRYTIYSVDDQDPSVLSVQGQFAF